MTDASGSRYFKGGLAAATAWLRDGVQVSEGACVGEAADDGTRLATGGAVCFGNASSSGASGASGAQAATSIYGRGQEGSRMVTLHDVLQVGSVRAADSLSIGKAALRGGESGELKVGGDVMSGKAFYGAHGFFATGVPGGAIVGRSGTDGAFSGLADDASGSLRILARPSARNISFGFGHDHPDAMSVDRSGTLNVSGSLCVGETCVDASAFGSMAGVVARQTALKDEHGNLQGMQTMAARQHADLVTKHADLAQHVQELAVRAATGQAALDRQMQALVTKEASDESRTQAQVKVLSDQVKTLQQRLLSQASQASQASQMASSHPTVASQASMASSHPTVASQEAASHPSSSQPHPSAIQSQSPSPSPSPSQARAMLSFDGSSLSSLPAGSPLSTWPNTGSLGSSHGAIGSGSPLPKLFFERGSSSASAKGTGFASLTPLGYLTVPGTISWSLHGAGSCAVIIVVARFSRLPRAAVTLAEFTGNRNGALALQVDPAGQASAGFYSDTVRVGWVSSGVPGGVVRAGKWIVFAARIGSRQAGQGQGHEMAIYIDGTDVAHASGTAPLHDLASTSNMFNKSAAGGSIKLAGGGGGDFDVARIIVYNGSTGLAPADVAAISRSLADQHK